MRLPLNVTPKMHPILHLKTCTSTGNLITNLAITGGHRQMAEIIRVTTRDDLQAPQVRIEIRHLLGVTLEAGAALFYDASREWRYLIAGNVPQDEVLMVFAIVDTPDASETMIAACIPDHLRFSTDFSSA